MRMNRRVVTGLAVVALCGATANGGQDQRAEIERMGRQLRTSAGVSTAEFERAMASGVPAQLVALLSQFTMQTLAASPGAPTTTLEARLKEAYSPWTDWADVTAPAPQVFELSGGQNRVLLVTWLVWIGGRGAPDTIPVIQAFERRNGRYVVVGETGSYLRDHGLFIRLVQAKDPKGTWFVAWGKRIGSPHSELTVALCSLDAKGIRVLWSRAGLPDGTLSHVASGLRLSFREYPRAGPDFREVVEE